MRPSNLYLTMRFLTWPAAWKGLIVLLITGFVVDVFDGPDELEDVVCLGQKSYDVNDEDDRQELLDDLGTVTSPHPDSFKGRHAICSAPP